MNYFLSSVGLGFCITGAVMVLLLVAMGIGELMFYNFWMGVGAFASFLFILFTTISYFSGNR